VDTCFYSDGYTIAGTLTEVAAPAAAALVITGSGRLNRDSDARLRRTRVTLLRTGVTRQVAEALAEANVLTLRYDKRGIGASSGDYLRVGMTENLADARAGLRWLAARAPGLPLLTVGHSEGTFYAARLAAEENVAGTILLSAPAQTGEQVIDWQIEKIIPTLPRAVRAITRVTGKDIATTQHIGRLVAGPFEGHVVDDLSHLLRPDPGWAGPRGYRRAVRQPVSPKVLSIITTWVTDHWGDAG